MSQWVGVWRERRSEGRQTVWSEPQRVAVPCGANPDAARDDVLAQLSSLGVDCSLKPRGPRILSALCQEW